MNIFEIYLDKIKTLIKKLNDQKLIELPPSLDGINVDVPPSNFDCDISTNVCMVLSKINKKSPIELANQLIIFIKDNDSDIDSISVAKPGYINIKFKTKYSKNFVREIHTNYKNFAVKTK
jgi:arginyl-tRNA synthetase